MGERDLDGQMVGQAFAGMENKQMNRKKKSNSLWLTVQGYNSHCREGTAAGANAQCSHGILSQEEQ